MYRVVFVPFPYPSCLEFLEKTKNWVEERPNKKFRPLVYDPGHIAEGWRPHPYLTKNLIDGSHIYIRGHGLPGSRFLTTYFNKNPVTVSIEVAIDRLLEMGLRPEFRGVIKFYSCNSGLDQPSKWLQGGEMKLDNDPFKSTVIGGEWSRRTNALAYVGARYFREKGFWLNKYIGYLGPLTGKYENSDSSPDGRNHKWCEVQVFDGLGLPRDKNSTEMSTRAIDAQKLF